MPAYIIFDTESVPDGKLLRIARYQDEQFTDEEAVEKAREEALEASEGRTDFISPVYQIPVALCLAKIAPSFLIEELVLLDEPEFRPREITMAFWKGLIHYKVPIVTFNGRGFDIPLMEMAAYRYGISAPNHFSEKFGSRYRFGDRHIDLMDWLTNFGAVRQGYSLNLLSKLLGKPGKMSTKGEDVQDMYSRGLKKEINEYCACDVLDTYFVFLRYLVLTGILTIEKEQETVRRTKGWIEEKEKSMPFLREYLDNWGDWEPWP
jgi:3'-5' exonuclease